MGASLSAYDKFGLPGLTSETTGQVYEKHFKTRDTSTFQDFHIAYIDFCKYFNAIMPGEEFDTPPFTKIEEFYINIWSPAKSDQMRREMFFEFMEAEVRNAAKLDDSILILAGIAAPAAAVIVKRASRHIPFVKNMRLDLVPNAIFVPVFTVGAVIATTAAQMTSNKETAAEVGEQRYAA